MDPKLIGFIGVVFVLWICCGKAWIESRRNWKQEYQEALISRDPEEIADCLVYKDFFLLPFIILSFVLSIPLISFCLKFFKIF